MLHRYALFTVFLVLGLLIAVSANRSTLKAEGAAPARSGEDEAAGSIKFSHKFHVEQVGADCSTCHAAVQTSKQASDNPVAGHDVCITCHEDEVSNSCAYCHTDPENIQPVQMRIPEIYFSHEQHLAMKDVDCQTCHAGVSQAENLEEVKLPEMATCYNCHNDREATNTCEACHTNFVTLLPQDHQRADFLHNHREITRLGGLTTDCQTCHTGTFCQQCHIDPELKGFTTGKDLMTEPDSKTSTKDSPKEMRLQFVHELNYRFTHGSDAKSRQSECASCHNTQTFCAQCHAAGGNITEGVFKPESHSLPGFTTLGIGSGGGLHAEEARRDIETCMSCHDVEGRDLVCLTCHTESGSVR